MEKLDSNIKKKKECFQLLQLQFLTGMKILHLLCAALHRWTKVHELLIEQRIRKDMLSQAVKESSAMLRYAPCLNFILTKTLYVERKRVSLSVVMNTKRGALQ